MPQSVIYRGAILTIVETSFKCPRCEYAYTEDFWYPQLDKSKTGLIYKKCKGCKSKIGITTCMTGDVKVWMKDEEKS